MIGEPERNTFIERIGRKIGFLFFYSIFTTFLYLLLRLLNKELRPWPYYYVAGLVLAIVLLGAIIRKLLK